MISIKDVLTFAAENPNTCSVVIFAKWLDFQFEGKPITACVKDLNIEGIKVLRDTSGSLILSNNSRVFFVSASNDKFFMGSGFRFDKAYKHVDYNEKDLDKISLLIRMPIEDILPFNWNW